MERAGATTMKGNPLTLVGPELFPGDHAPDFSVVDGTLSTVDLAKTGNNVRIISVVPEGRGITNRGAGSPCGAGPRRFTRG